jgi:methionyl-tRNA formyltransferase
MGTPEFAAGILDAIIQKGFNVVGVITAPDKPAGRGQKVQFSAVKNYALENNLRLLQPAKLRDPEFLSELESLKADVQVVVAFRMLPDVVWKMPPLGTFNLHASLLPDYRGAAPINWAIINGETKTGVTTFFIDDKIDTGATILSREISIGDDENAGSLHDRLLDLGREAVTSTLTMIAEGNASATPQTNSAELKEAPKLDRTNTRIDWTQSSATVHNLIRGLSPYPSAWTMFQDAQEWNVKIFEARIHDAKYPPGKISIDNKRMFIGTGDGSLEVLQLQLPGKKRMAARDVLNGMGFSDNAIAE